MRSFICVGLGPDPRMYPDSDPAPFVLHQPAKSDLPLTYQEIPPKGTETDEFPILALLELLFCLLEAL